MLPDSPRACLILRTCACVRTHRQAGTCRGGRRPVTPERFLLTVLKPGSGSDFPSFSGTNESLPRVLPESERLQGPSPQCAVPPPTWPRRPERRRALLCCSSLPRPWPPPPHLGHQPSLFPGLTRGFLTPLSSLPPLLLAFLWLPSALRTKSQPLCLAFEAH